MVENLRGKVVEFESRARKLRSRAIEYFNLYDKDSIRRLVTSDRSEIINSIRKLYEGLRKDITRVFHSDSSVSGFPLIKEENIYYEYHLLEMIACLDQISGFLEGKKEEIVGMIKINGQDGLNMVSWWVFALVVSM